MVQKALCVAADFIGFIGVIDAQKYFIHPLLRLIGNSGQACQFLINFFLAHIYLTHQPPPDIFGPGDLGIVLISKGLDINSPAGQQAGQLIGVHVIALCQVANFGLYFLIGGGDAVGGRLLQLQTFINQAAQNLWHQALTGLRVQVQV